MKTTLFCHASFLALTLILGLSEGQNHAISIRRRTTTAEDTQGVFRKILNAGSKTWIGQAIRRNHGCEPTAVPSSVPSRAPTSPPTSRPTPTNSPTSKPTATACNTGPTRRAFLNNAELRAAIQSISAAGPIHNSGLQVFQDYGPIESWNVSRVTDFDSVFRSYNGFRSYDLNCWNTSQVVNMHLVFAEGNFSGFVSKWDTGKVTSLNGAFGRSTVFRGEELLHWNTSNVQDMFGTFAYMPQPGTLAIENWDVSKVRTFDSTFYGTDFTGDLGNWDVSSAIKTRFMFNGCKNFNGNIGRWNMSRVEWTDYMFLNAYKFNQDISGWDVSKLQIANAMFANARAFNQDISGWKVSSLKEGAEMFYAAGSFNQNLCPWRAHLPTNPLTIWVPQAFLHSGCPYVDVPTSINGPYCHVCASV